MKITACSCHAVIFFNVNIFFFRCRTLKKRYANDRSTTEVEKSR